MAESVPYKLPVVVWELPGFGCITNKSCIEVYSQKETAVLNLTWISSSKKNDGPAFGIFLSYRSDDRT